MKGLEQLTKALGYAILTSPVDASRCITSLFCREETSALYGLRSAATVAGNKPPGLLQGLAVSCHALLHGRIVQSLSNGIGNLSKHTPHQHIRQA